MNNSTYSDSQRKALIIATIIALVFCGYFLRNFFTVIAFSAILAFICNPIYKRLLRRSGKPGRSSALTLLIAILAIVIPLIFVIMLTGVQVNSLLNMLKGNDFSFDYESTRGYIVDWINHTASNLGLSFRITGDSINSTLTHALQAVSNATLSFLKNTASSAFGFITTSIIFIYVFISMLKNQHEMVEVITHLNPLGKEATQLYLRRVGAMTNAMVRGQFVIAFAQGVTDAILVYLGGFHYAFFFFAMLFTVLSIIPLGGGIIAIPLGIFMALTGNIVGGLVVVLGHILIVTNIDNVLRPKLVPDTARLDPALLLLSVFAGIGLFGFLGIVLGPVVMILITTTVSVFLQVFKNVDMNGEELAPVKRSLWKRVLRKA